MHIHTYRSTIRWSGSTGIGYEGYDRTHDAEVDPASAGLRLSSDPAFRGDPSLLNPEQLLVVAAASCQLLSFLAVAARARIDVVAYTDEALGEMPERSRDRDREQPVMSIERIELRPQIVVRGDVPIEKVQRLVAIAHDECFIANSLRTDITVNATIELA